MNEIPDVKTLQAQLVELQSQVAFQEDTIAALDAVVARQQRQIEHLLQRWDEHKTQLEAIGAELDKGPVDVKPPHY